MPDEKFDQPNQQNTKNKKKCKLVDSNTTRLYDFVGNSRVAETAGIGSTELEELERELENLVIGEKGNTRPVFHRKTIKTFLLQSMFSLDTGFN